MKIFDIRPAIPSDISFIYQTWLKSYKHDSAFGKSVRTSIFFPRYRTILDTLLAKADVLVACHPDNSDIILGYMVSEPLVLHYAFVKESFRRLGVAKALYEASGMPLVLSHRTEAIQGILDTHSLVYDPFILFKGDK